jgi:uncharacterized membrane protein YcaP (DUF421 family)
MTIDLLFGNGRELEWYQMGTRALVVFLIALTFIRFSGTRAFGMRSPFDNVLSILLGAVLSRTITGASPFFPTVFAGLVLTILHYIFGWFSLRSEFIGKIVKGAPITIFENGQMIKSNMQKSLVTEKDLRESMRRANINSFEDVELAVVERSGRISIVKKIPQPKKKSTH